MFQELVVDQFGVSIGKTSERIVLKKRGEVLGEYSILDMEDVIVMTKGVTISSDVLQLLLENGIQIYFTDYREEPYAMLYSPYLHGTVKTRREQFASLSDGRGVYIAKQFAVGKVQNQINNLKYFLRSRGGMEREEIESEIAGMERYLKELKRIEERKLEEVRQTILSLEAHAAHHYWRGVERLIQDKIPSFKGREKWDAQDPVNMMLNYGYGVLGAKVLGAIVRAGLEPYAGFIHADRSGKPSLRFDLVEEFRAPIVDRVVISLLSKGFKPEVEEWGDGKGLAMETRKHFKEKLFKRFDAREKYKGKDYLLKTIIQLQARSLASYFREGKTYKAFIAKW
ncbi:CRISPR-associated endonuclease Cas1 2 [[Clostridium] ultunense Esp]|nr:CRISPR-associated endonuclease Cas1 2 [[Clostridium] ultunense Esp]